MRLDSRFMQSFRNKRGTINDFGWLIYQNINLLCRWLEWKWIKLMDIRWKQFREWIRWSIRRALRIWNYTWSYLTRTKIRKCWMGNRYLRAWESWSSFWEFRENIIWRITIIRKFEWNFIVKIKKALIAT